MIEPTKEQMELAEKATRNFNECCGHLQIKCSMCQKKLEAVALLLASREREVAAGFVKAIENNRQYPYRPCPTCGKKLELGATDRDGMKYGCYSPDCPSVKDYRYFNITLSTETARSADAVEYVIKTIREEARRYEV